MCSEKTRKPVNVILTVSYLSYRINSYYLSDRKMDGVRTNLVITSTLHRMLDHLTNSGFSPLGICMMEILVVRTKLFPQLSMVRVGDCLKHLTQVVKPKVKDIF